MKLYLVFLNDTMQLLNLNSVFIYRVSMYRCTTISQSKCSSEAHQPARTACTVRCGSEGERARAGCTRSAAELCRDTDRHLLARNQPRL